MHVYATTHALTCQVFTSNRATNQTYQSDLTIHDNNNYYIATCSSMHVFTTASYVRYWCMLVKCLVHDPVHSLTVANWWQFDQRTRKLKHFYLITGCKIFCCCKFDVIIFWSKLVKVKRKGTPLWVHTA